jgi:hypothetical protein
MRGQGETVELASYDIRLLMAARALGIALSQPWYPRRDAPAPAKLLIFTHVYVISNAGSPFKVSRRFAVDYHGLQIPLPALWQAAFVRCYDPKNSAVRQFTFTITQYRNYLI